MTQTGSLSQDSRTSRSNTESRRFAKIRAASKSDDDRRNHGVAGSDRADDAHCRRIDHERLSVSVHDQRADVSIETTSVSQRPPARTFLAAIS